VLTSATHAELSAHLLRADGQEDLCFALWRPSTGESRYSAVVSDPILPRDGERNVHGNASFMPHYFDRALDVALESQSGLAFLHAHLGPGWQPMSPDDSDTERKRAGAILGATALPLLGMTIGTDGSISARFWNRIAPRTFEPAWCESVRVVGEAMRVFFDDTQVPPPPVQGTQIRTVSAWGEQVQADLARLRVGVIGVGSVGAVVAEALARIGVRRIALIDFDTVELHNLDRLLHASLADVGNPKVEVAERALRRSATAVDPEIDASVLSVCEVDGFRHVLDCDVLFSCVDRPWPRKVLNVAAYAHLVPVVDGGIRIAAPAGRLKRADWKALTALPGRICLECSGQFNAADVMLERDGALDDAQYIESLPLDHHLRRRENVFAFSTSLASLEVGQMLTMVARPLGVFDPGVQTYHFVTGTLDQDWPSCEPNCPYSTDHLSQADKVIPGTVEEHRQAVEMRRRFAEMPIAPASTLWERLLRKLRS
jgi:molybdopterin-synthase adenylyltransferase